MIAAPVQCDVDRIPQGSHFARVPPTGSRIDAAGQPSLGLGYRHAAMVERYRPQDPFNAGMLEVGEGHRVYWDESGNPAGKPAVLLHGGPGAAPWTGGRRLFDPARYRIVQLDQRMSGRSTPSAADPMRPLTANTTHHLIRDLEQLRTFLGIDRVARLRRILGRDVGACLRRAPLLSRHRDGPGVGDHDATGRYPLALSRRRAILPVRMATVPRWCARLAIVGRNGSRRLLLPPAARAARPCRS